MHPADPAPAVTESREALLVESAAHRVLLRQTLSVADMLPRDTRGPAADASGKRHRRRTGIGAMRLNDERVLVGARGFEPPTSSSRTMRATKLRHAPTECSFDRACG